MDEKKKRGPERKSRQEQIREITDWLEEGVKEVFESDKYREMLKCMSKFHHYSLNNCLLIAMQYPSASLVAGYRAWQKEFDRQVRKGEKGIRILAPCRYKVEKDNADDGDKEIIEITGFRVISVFAYEQTEGRELPMIGVNELTGDVKNYHKLFNALKAICPVPICSEDIQGGANGYYDDGAYKLNNYDIRRTVKGYGSVQILNENQEKITEDYAAHGDKLTIRFVPEDGSVVDSAEINGKSFENGKTITVTEDLDISAVFKMDLSRAALTLPEAVYWYTGKEICPDVSATVNGHRVPANAFTVVYENNVEMGAATVNLIAVEDGTCTGKSESVTFQIRDHVVSNTDRINRALRETVSSKKVSVRWGRVPTADGYDVYVAKCGSKFPSKAVRSVRGNDALSVSFSKINGKKISSKNNYKAYVKAFRTVDGKKTYIAKSRDLHAAGPKTSRTDAWKVTAAKNTIFLKPGNAASAKANIIKNNTSKKLLGSDHGQKLYYWTTDKKIAVVSGSGRITAVSEGTCRVYCMALNGANTNITVIVK